MSIFACSLLMMTANPTLLDHAASQWRRTPQMRIDDGYKWLFHATMGGEHAVIDDSGPRRWMEAEWKSLKPATTGEPLIELLTPDGTWVRVNLRPYKDRGGESEQLLQLFVRSAKAFSTKPAVFLAVWNQLGKRLRQGSIGKMDRQGWVRLDTKYKPHGYPAIHHSDVYERLYQPAYRVMSGVHAKQIRFP